MSSSQGHDRIVSMGYSDNSDAYFYKTHNHNNLSFSTVSDMDALRNIIITPDMISSPPSEFSSQSASLPQVNDHLISRQPSFMSGSSSLKAPITNRVDTIFEDFSNLKSSETIETINVKGPSKNRPLEKFNSNSPQMKDIVVLSNENETSEPYNHFHSNNNIDISSGAKQKQQHAYSDEEASTVVINPVMPSSAVHQPTSSSPPHSSKNYLQYSSSNATPPPTAQSQNNRRIDDLKNLATQLFQRKYKELPLEDYLRVLCDPDNLDSPDLRLYYLLQYSFSENLLESLRILCKNLYFRGESQYINRIIESFGQVWAAKFPRNVFNKNLSDLTGNYLGIYLIAYSLILLNSDLHSKNLSSHISRDKFVKNTLEALKQEESTQSSNNSYANATPAAIATLKSYYDSIMANELQLLGVSDSLSSNRQSSVSARPLSRIISGNASLSIHKGQDSYGNFRNSASSKDLQSDIPPPPPPKSPQPLGFAGALKSKAAAANNTHHTLRKNKSIASLASAASKSDFLRQQQQASPSMRTINTNNSSASNKINAEILSHQFGDHHYNSHNHQKSETIMITPETSSAPGVSPSLGAPGTNEIEITPVQYSVNISSKVESSLRAAAAIVAVSKNSSDPSIEINGNSKNFVVINSANGTANSPSRSVISANKKMTQSRHMNSEIKPGRVPPQSMISNNNNGNSYYQPKQNYQHQQSQNYHQPPHNKELYLYEDQIVVSLDDDDLDNGTKYQLKSYLHGGKTYHSHHNSFQQDYRGSPDTGSTAAYTTANNTPIYNSSKPRSGIPRDDSTMNEIATTGDVYYLDRGSTHRDYDADDDKDYMYSNDGDEYIEYDGDEDDDDESDNEDQTTLALAGPPWVKEGLIKIKKFENNKSIFGVKQQTIRSYFSNNGAGYGSGTILTRSTTNSSASSMSSVFGPNNEPIGSTGMMSYVPAGHSIKWTSNFAVVAQGKFNLFSFNTGSKSIVTATSLSLLKAPSLRKKFLRLRLLNSSSTSQLNIVTNSSIDTDGSDSSVGDGNWMKNAVAVATISLTNTYARIISEDMPNINSSSSAATAASLKYKKNSSETYWALKLPTNFDFDENNPNLSSKMKKEALSYINNEDNILIFSAGTEEIAEEYIFTCNYWAAKCTAIPTQIEPLTNKEYGWSDSFFAKIDLNNTEDTSNTKINAVPVGDILSIQIHPWEPMQASIIESHLSDKKQLIDLFKYVESLESMISEHVYLKEKIDDYIHKVYLALNTVGGASYSRTRQGGGNVSVGNVQLRMTKMITSIGDNWNLKYNYLVNEHSRYKDYVLTLKRAIDLRSKH